jgi:putative lipoprotein
MLRPLFPALLALMLGVAAAQGTGTGTVSGTINYRQRVALPQDAIVAVSLQDTTLADAPARILGESTIATQGAQVPIPFRIDYDPAAIDPARRYAVRATITVGGRLLFASTTAYPVLTGGAGNTATIEVFMLLPGAGGT